MSGVMVAVSQLGVKVSGSDNEFAYGRALQLLKDHDIPVHYGFKEENLQCQPQPELIVISRGHIRGNPEIEFVLNHHLPYLSLPEFLSFYFFNGATNILITGSKGKTTTTSMLTTILQKAGLAPGYLIGGYPVSGIPGAKLGHSLNVIEADDYSSLWWNDAPKSHFYRPSVVVLTNSFRDHPEHQVNDSLRQRHITALVEQIPQNGLLIVVDAHDLEELDRIKKYARCMVRTIATSSPEDEGFQNYSPKNKGVHFVWKNVDFELELNGEMNVKNAIAATMVAQHFNVTTHQAAKALQSFKGVHGRLELLHQDKDICIYMDNYGYLPESLFQNYRALQEKHADQRKVLIYQILIVDGIPEVQNLLVEALSLWDKVFLIQYQPPSGIMPKMKPEYRVGLLNALNNKGCNAVFVDNLFDNTDILINEIHNNDLIFFSIHPREEENASRAIKQILSHENINY